MATEPQENPKPENPVRPEEPYLGFWKTLFRTLARSPGTYALGIVGFLLLAGIVVYIGSVLRNSGNLLNDLAEPARARGIITFIISFAAIGVALILVLQSLFGSTNQDQFRQAREIYAGLMGILGTIVGFYFGSADKAIPSLTLAEPRFTGRELITHVTGGTGPYRYRLRPDSFSDSASMGERVSQDGWIQHRFRTDRPDTLTLQIDVWDNRNAQASLEVKPVKVARTATNAADTTGSKAPASPPGAGADSVGGSQFPKGK